MNKKILTALLSILVLFSVLATPIFAEEGPDTEPLEPTGAYEEFVAKVEAYAATGYEPTVTYTPDSIVSEGIYLEPYSDTLKLELGFTIVPDLPLGIKIYDDPTTPIIEGVRVNGEVISDYKVAVDLNTPKPYIVEVRLVYAEGLVGTLAKISNGDFNWETILDEPLIIMQGFYYILAALSIIIGGLGLSVSKKKKVKTADEIAAQVDTRVKEGCETFAIQYADLLKTNMLPVFNTVVDTNKAVVKAITLSTSKTKEAPVALLDLLKEISDVDVNKAIDDARQEVLKHIADADAKRAAIHETLSHIAQGTYQEVRNVEQTTEEILNQQSAPAQEAPKADEIESVF